MQLFSPVHNSSAHYGALLFQHVDERRTLFLMAVCYVYTCENENVRESGLIAKMTKALH
jgi:hypothetical protein